MNKDVLKTDGSMIRWAVKSDLSKCVKIEEACFDFPIDQREFERILRERNAHSRVIELEPLPRRKKKRVIGFVLYEIHKRKIRLETIAIHPDHQRHGYGRKLIEMLLEKMETNRLREIVAEVREIDLNSQIFFRAMGFEAVQDRQSDCRYNRNNYVFVFAKAQKQV